MKKPILKMFLCIITFAFVFFLFSINVEAKENIVLTIDVNGGIELENNTFEIEKGSILSGVLEENKIDDTLIKHSDEKKILDGFIDKLEDGTKYTGEEEINEDTVIYALWKDETDNQVNSYVENSFKITFELNGGVCESCSSQTVLEGNLATKPLDPTKTDHNFIGWYTDPELNNSFDFNSPVNDNYTLYAKYEFVEKVELEATSSEVDFGNVAVKFTNDVVKKIILKNTGNVAIKLSLENITTTGPFINPEFENNHVLAPNEEYEVTIIAKGGGQNSDRSGLYTVDYKFTGTSDSGSTSLVTVKGKLNILSPDTKILYTTHVQNIGWQGYVSNGVMAGTAGQSLRLEGIKIKLENSPYSGSVEYRTHIQNIGWENGWKLNDQISGTSGRSLRLEAIEIRLTGEISNYYDVYYRVHAQNFGWLGWARNGEQSGTAGYSYRLEGIEIKLVKKGELVSNYGKSAVFYDKQGGAVVPVSDGNLISYKTHVQNIGWQNYVNDGQMAGTTGQSLRLEGIKIKLINQKYSGDIEYRTHIQNIGWEDGFKKNDAMSGTTGRSLRLEAIELRLTGEMANHYDIYYRVHAQNFGWLGWARNGERSGTAGYAFRLEGIEIKLVSKGETFIEYGGSATFIDSMSGAYTPKKDASVNSGWKNIDGKIYYFYEDGTKATYIKKIGNERYEFSKDGELQHSNIKILADISYHNGDINFTQLWNSDEIDGIILRVGYSTTMDTRFLGYLAEIRKLGIPYSIYHFSYAENEQEAINEANSLVTWYVNNNLNPTMGVFYDIEDWSTRRSTSDNISISDYDTIISTYKRVLNEHGINMSLYTYKYYAENRLSEYARSTITWIAHYNNNCLYTGSYRGWQYTSTGTLPGINGNVDLSIFYY